MSNFDKIMAPEDRPNSEQNETIDNLRMQNTQLTNCNIELIDHNLQMLDILKQTLNILGKRDAHIDDVRRVFTSGVLTLEPIKTSVPIVNGLPQILRKRDRS